MAPRHAPPVHRHAARPISLSFLLGILPSDLLRLPHAALQAGDPAHRDGVLLLLSAVAMAVLALSSFALLRRLRKLESV